jgi:hypothetical protein
MPIGMFGLELRLVAQSSGACKWQLLVDFHVLINVAVGCNPPRPSPSYALYESAPMASDEDCQTMPVTLTKVIDRPGDSCGGALPNTVILDI